MLLSRQVSHTSNSSHLFWNLKDPVKITYHPSRFGFFHKLLSMHDVGHMLHLIEAQQLPPLSLSSCTSELSPTSDKDVGLDRRFLYGHDLKKYYQ